MKEQGFDKYVESLKYILDQTESSVHSIKTHNVLYQPFKPTKYIYSYFFYNTLYNIKWQASVQTNKVVYYLNGQKESVKRGKILNYAFSSTKYTDFAKEKFLSYVLSEKI